MRNYDSMIANGTFAELWQRRTNLTHDEMAAMYSIVRGALKSYYPLELHALGDDKEELVSQFIYFKVFRLEATQDTARTFPVHSAPSNDHAVCAYFRRYLIDCLRSAGNQRNVSFDDDDVTVEVERQATFHYDSVHSVLIQYGLDESIVRESATQFIESLDESDRVLLAGSLGWLSNERGGLVGIAGRYGIASYHYRARKLGVTVKKGACPDDFAATSIGQWIESTLGIDITIGNRTAILLVLGILSEQSGAPE